jgi:hypothetical protein
MQIGLYLSRVKVIRNTSFVIRRHDTTQYLFPKLLAPVKFSFLEGAQEKEEAWPLAAW